MKSRLVVVAAVLVMAACRGHETVTGGYGSEGVTGVVTMAVGMSNSSPQGVRVSVGGTGMSAVLGTDGRFSFFGVPENAQLIFDRSDVHATIKVAASIAPLQIELNANSANVGRRRAVPSQPLMQVEGTITAVSDSSITVHDSHNRDVTATITTTDTTIYRGNTKLQPSDLAAGDQVHMMVKVSGDTKTAVIILLQNSDNSNDGENGGQTMTANGTVTDVGTSSLKVSTVPKGIVTVNVDDKTVIRKQGSVIQVSDIKAGDQVNAMGTRVDDQTLLARQIEVRGVSGHK